MNKLVKGSIAGAAGIALLLGGAGTLAAWNSEADLTGTAITSGTLTIDAEGAATAFYGETTDVVELIVPGDVIEVTQDVTIDATGDNLTASLTIDEALLTGDLADNVIITVAAFAGGTELTNLSNLTAAEATSIDSVVVTIEFEDVEDEVAQDLTLDLANLKILLQQV